jgi:hypothetical protein
MKSKAKKPGLIDKSFKVPVDVIRSLEALAPVFGSNGRAIQVGTELLINMRRKPKVEENHQRVAAQTYSITPRTLDLIEGARQESEESCGLVPRFGSALPEVLKASTEF